MAKAPVPIETQVAAVTTIAEKHGTPEVLAAVATLRLVAAYAEPLRFLIKFLRGANLEPGETPSEDEKALLLAHPAMQELLKGFPDAKLESITPVRLAQPDDDLEETET
jgi:hypothetical protein